MIQRDNNSLVGDSGSLKEVATALPKERYFYCVVENGVSLIQPTVTGIDECEKLGEVLEWFSGAIRRARCNLRASKG